MVINPPAVSKCCNINASSEITILWLPGSAQGPDNKDLFELQGPLLILSTSYSWLWDPTALPRAACPFMPVPRFCAPSRIQLRLHAGLCSGQFGKVSGEPGSAAALALCRGRRCVPRHQGPVVLPCLQHRHPGAPWGCRQDGEKQEQAA